MDRRSATRHDGRTPRARAARRRGPSARLTMLTALLAAVGVAWGGAASTATTPRPAPAMSGGSYPGAITAGPDGNLWFTEHIGNRDRPHHPARARSPSSRSAPRPRIGPGDIAAGPDGNLWFTESTRRPDRPDHARPASSPSSPPASRAGARPSGITAGPRRQPLVHRVRRAAGSAASPPPASSPSSRPASPATAARRDHRRARRQPLVHRAPTPRATASGASRRPARHRVPGRAPPSGPDRHHRRPRRQPLVHRADGHRIGRITAGGARHRVPGRHRARSSPAGITAGPDGNLWFTENAAATASAASRPRASSPSSRRGSARAAPPRHHRRPGRQPLVHRVRRQPDRAHHPRGRRQPSSRRPPPSCASVCRGTRSIRVLVRLSVRRGAGVPGDAQPAPRPAGAADLPRPGASPEARARTAGRGGVPAVRRSAGAS